MNQSLGRGGSRRRYLDLSRRSFLSSSAAAGVLVAGELAFVDDARAQVGGVDDVLLETTFGIRATFLDFIEDPWRHVGRESEAARFHADGLLVVEDGRIADFGAHDEVAARHAGLAVTTISDRLIVPGFIDGHVHFPQTRVIGAFGEHLLPWLQKWVIPEEIKFKDRAYARAAAARFFDNLVASGTTTCQAFTTTAPAATEELFDEAARRNMRLIAGLTGFDRLAPPGYASGPEDFYRDSKRLIERYHRQGRGLYAITPRNAHVSRTS